MNFNPPTRPLPPARRRRWWIHLVLLGGYSLYLGIGGLSRHAGSHHDGTAPAHPVGRLLFGLAWQILTYGVVLGLALYASRATREELLLR